MVKIDKRVDNYISKSAVFAKPILIHLRQLVHAACPDAEETIKWSFACFDYKGPLCSMAAFKEHCSFGFWKAAIMKDAEKLKSNQATAMGHLGKIRSLADLPPDKIITAYIKEAIKLNDDRIKLPARQTKTIKEEPVIPGYFAEQLSKSKTTSQKFSAFSASQKREYIDWITEAKTEATKNKRTAKAIAQITEGKSLNWKYQTSKQSINADT